jgi:DNA-binding beta-propeller fold protein YncE
LTRVGLVIAFAAITILCYASLCFSIWHCGDIELPAAPQALIIDPITGDVFVSTGTELLLRIDEASYEATPINLLHTPSALGFNPASRLLYIVHSDADMVTALNVDTSDTTLVPVGDGPTALAIDALRDYAYVLNSGANSISVMEGTSPIDTILCSGSPVAAAADPSSGAGYVVLTDANLLFRFDSTTGDTSYFLTGLAPTAIEIDPEKQELYVANSGESTISVFNAATDSIFTVPVGGPPTALALNPETRKLFVGTAANQITIVDTDTYAVQAVLLPSEPQFVSIDALSERAFASLEGMVVEVDSGGDTLLVTVPGSPGMIGVNPWTNTCYVSNPISWSLSVLEAADYTGVAIPSSGGPGEIVINMETHKVYTPNWFAAKVTVIDGYTNAKSTIRVADGPNGLAIDPASDDLFVVCAWADILTVKRHGSPDTTLAPLGGYAHGIDLNPNTGKVYVSNRFTRDMSVIDMQTLDTTLVRLGGYPCYVTLNIDHNKIYVPNRVSWTLSVVDGIDLSNTYVSIGHKPTQAHMNPVTNTVYSVEPDSRSISAVDGMTLERTKIPVGLQPSTLDINPNTNKIYVSSRPDGEVTVVEGDTHRRRPVKCVTGLGEVEVDPWLDRVFTVSWDNDCVTLINGNFLSTLRIPVGYEPHSSAYDPVLEKLYVSNHAGNSVEIIQLREKISPRIEVTIDSLPGDVAYTAMPTITGSAASLRTPRNFGIMKVLWKIDNLRGGWHEATIVGEGTDISWHFSTPPLLLGEHLVFVTALDSTACTLSSSSNSSLLRLSDVAAYEFTCLSPPPAAPAIIDPEDPGRSLDLTWTPVCGNGGWYELELSSDPAFSQEVIRKPGIREPRYTLEPLDMRSGVCYLRVAAVDYPHGKCGPFSDVYSVEAAGQELPGLPSLAAALDAYPNPSSGNVMLKLLAHRTQEAECEIYDVEGRLVTILSLAPDNDCMTVKWDATNAQGRLLPPGVYYARLRGPELDLRRKIVLIR